MLFRSHDGRLPFVDRPAVPSDSLNENAPDNISGPVIKGDQEAIILME